MRVGSGILLGFGAALFAAAVRFLEKMFAHADAFGGDLDQFPFDHKLKGFFQFKFLEGAHAAVVVFTRCADIGQLLGADHVNFQIIVAVVLADDLALVNLFPRLDKENSAIKEGVETVGGGLATLDCNQ